MTPFDERLLERAGRAGIAVSSTERAQLEAYFGLLCRWNARINLTALPLEGAPAATLDRLFIEPLAAAPFVTTSSLAWVDIGSGGGSPAIPLKVVRPDARLVMVESRGRKAAFLREVVRELGLRDAEVAETRFEAFAAATETGSLDLLTLRAIRLDEPLARLIRSTLARDGRILIFQSSPVGSVQVPEGLRIATTAQLTDAPAFLHVLEGI